MTSLLEIYVIHTTPQVRNWTQYRTTDRLNGDFLGRAARGRIMRLPSPGLQSNGSAQDLIPFCQRVTEGVFIKPSGRNGQKHPQDCDPEDRNQQRGETIETCIDRKS